MTGAPGPVPGGTGVSPGDVVPGAPGVTPAPVPGGGAIDQTLGDVGKTVNGLLGGGAG